MTQPPTLRFPLGAVCACLSALLVVAAVRPWGLGLLGWVAMAPLFAGLPLMRSWTAVGLSSGVVALAFCSVAYEATAALGAGWHAAALVLGTAPFVISSVAAKAVAGRLPRHLTYVCFALFWAAAEYVPARTELLGDHALVLSRFGYVADGLPAMHLARFSSVTATSVVLLLGNAFVAQVLVSVLRRARRCLTGGVLVPLALFGGVNALAVGAQATAPAPGPGSYDVAVLQPNTPTALLAAASAVPAVANRHIGALVRLASSGSGAPAPAGGAGRAGGPGGPGTPNLVVFPEGAWPQALHLEQPLASVSPALLPDLLRMPTSLIGAPGAASQGMATNSAFLWADGDLRHVYAKRHLVPVGEAGLTGGPHTPATFRLPPAGTASAIVAPLICYDIAFPATVRAAASAGAQLLAVLTDDAFAARGDVPHLHLRLARFRAVESGLPVAFASNTGPSALIGPGGALVAVSPAGQATLLRARLGEGAGPTPYVIYGDLVGALVCAVAALLALTSAASVAGKRGGGGARQPAQA